MGKVINLVDYRKEEEIYDGGDIYVIKTKSGKLLVEIENYLFFKTLEDLKATYVDFKNQICNDFNITNNNKLDEVDFKLKYSTDNKFYYIDLNNFYITNFENLVEKLNYIITNIKEGNVVIEE
ncbi:hypothetical protein PM021_10290 [Clostridium perfringens]|uniref:hypothetical protein n=1 Tax=Clostridium perfringens TaxID=1502 RepID=UPI00232F5C13|nr:hypothetical protein [Clostridium perfringens]MDB2046497.1 hypothetical protein [Clostridium perfringens]MDB2058346.1 hypothetical protein [Clostridium perfringens]